MRIVSQLSVLFFSFITLSLGANKNLPSAVKNRMDAGKVSFTENKGQVKDQFHRERSDILFGGTDGTMTYFLKSNGVSYQTKKPAAEAGFEEIIYRLDVEWLNCNPEARVEAKSPFDGIANFYSNSTLIKAKTYKEVVYADIYKGIDLKWYSKGDRSQLKYDFIVKPGADYTQIKLNFKGAEKISVNAKGELEVLTSNGRICEQAPVVFQDGKTLAAKWIVKDQTASFSIQNVNKNSTMIIDPAIRTWGTFYGNTGIDEAYFCSTDVSGNVYIAGNTSSATSTLIATVGSHQAAYGGNDDAFLAKFSPTGVRLWATYYGGIGQDYGNACTVDGSGNVYLVGRTNSTAGISTAGVHQAANGGGYDGFVVKFNLSGVRQWASYYGGISNDAFESCKTDALGNVYLVGTTSSTLSTAITSAGAHQTVYGGGTSDAFIVKFNTSGVRQWATFYGGNGTDDGFECAIDASSNVYVCGSTGSSGGISTAGAHQVTYAGGFGDGFLVKFNTSGVRQWGTYYGTNSGTDPARACAVDATGNVFIAGTTGGGNMATVGAHQTVVGGGSDGYLVKFNTSGVRQWATFYGGTGNDAFNYCTTDAAGNVFACGSTFSSLQIATPGSYQTNQVGVSDGFLVKFTTSGVRDWGTYYGGTGTDEAWGCATDGSGNVYLAGRTASTGTFIATAGSHQTVNNGSTDGFLAKLIDCQLPPSPTNVTNPTNQVVCSGKSATLSASSSGTVNWFTASTGGTAFGSGTTIATSTLSAGTFTFYAEAFTCSNSATRTAVTVTVNPSPTVTVNSGSVCTGKSFTIVPGGASTYTVQGGNTIVSPLSNTSYTVIGTGSNGCVSANTATAVVSVVANPTITVNSGAICNGNTFTMNPSGGLTYTFSSGSGTVSPSSNTSYTVTGANAAGCTHTAVSTVTVNALPTVGVNSGTICSGNVFTMVPTGAVSYTFSSGSNTVAPSVNTTYTVTGASAQGCTATAQSTVTVLQSPTVAVNSGSICSGKSFTITPSGASTYTIQGGNSIVSPLSNTSYTVRGTGSNGCVSVNTATAAVTVFSNPAISANSGSVCIGNTFTIVPSGGISYTYSSGSNTVSPTINTSYTVIGASAQGCTNTAVSSVSVNALPNVAVNSGSICSGNTFTMSPTGAVSYSYSSGSATVSPPANTAYTVTGASAAGCLNTAVSNVTVFTTPTVNVSGGAVCPGGSFTLTPSGANTYSYSSGSAIVSPTVTSTYTVFGYSSQGCVSAPALATVIYTTSLNVTITGTGQVCSGSSLSLTANGASTYTWSNSSNSPIVVVTPTVNTTYSVLGVSSTCSNTAVFNVTVLPLPSLTVTGSPSVICVGESATITATGANSYSWSTNQNNASISVTPTTTTTYTVTGTSISGCLNSAVITQSVSTCTGLSINMENNSNIQVYPNPSAGSVTIEVGAPTKAMLFNSLGELILSVNLNSENNNQVQLDHLAKGIYYLRFIGSNETKKLIIN
jgi:hypothetical protein